MIMWWKSKPLEKQNWVQRGVRDALEQLKLGQLRAGGVVGSGGGGEGS